MQSINYEKADHPGRSLALEIGNYDIQLPSPTSVDPDSYPTELSTIEESVDARIKGYEHITVAKLDNINKNSQCNSIMICFGSYLDEMSIGF